MESEITVGLAVLFTLGCALCFGCGWWACSWKRRPRVEHPYTLKTQFAGSYPLGIPQNKYCSRCGCPI